MRQKWRASTKVAPARPKALGTRSDAVRERRLRLAAPQSPDWLFTLLLPFLALLPWQLLPNGGFVVRGAVESAFLEVVVGLRHVGHVSSADNLRHLQLLTTFTGASTSTNPLRSTWRGLLSRFSAPQRASTKPKTQSSEVVLPQPA